MRIAALLTCHNRKTKTAVCLSSLRAQELPGKRFGFGPDAAEPDPRTSFCIDVYITDDASIDGTSRAVREMWPEARILPGDGDLFWCGGMRRAWAEAARDDPDYFLLLNDDTVLAPYALSALLDLAPSPSDRVIVVAPIMDPTTGNVVFGGHVDRTGRPPVPNGSPIRCKTMNANCTLVPRAVFEEIGMFHSSYTHSMGDFDYGFAATRAGISVIQAGRVLGESVPNAMAGTWRDRSLGRIARFRLLWGSKKGLPFIEWVIYCRRNTGWLWPYRVFSPALRILCGR